VQQERLVQAHERSEVLPTAPREAEGGLIGCKSTGDKVASLFSCVEKWLDRKSGNISHCIIIRYEYKVRWHLGYTLWRSCTICLVLSCWLASFMCREQGRSLPHFSHLPYRTPPETFSTPHPRSAPLHHCGWTGNACLSICRTRARCSVSTARRRLGAWNTSEGMS
jgi:hypothetical protein